MSVPKSLIKGLKKRYGERQRHYHSWAHIEALLGHYDRLQDQVTDKAAVLWALYWHDAIYDPKATDNEEASAALLVEQAAGVLVEKSLNLAYDIVAATKAHLIPEHVHNTERSDLSLFLDMDLSILAAPEAVFDQYEADVRAEYAFVPEDKFRAARADILQRFLDRERLYFSQTCFDAWETPARANLARSIARLGS